MSDETPIPSYTTPEVVVEAPPEVKKEMATIQARLPINSDESGIFRPKSLDESYRLAKAYHASGMLPKSYRTPEMVMTAMQFALELGLKPLTALRQIAVINGNPALWGDLPLALCQQSGKLERIREYFFDKDQKELKIEHGNILAEAEGAVCIVWRKGDDQPAEAVFTMLDARRAGITSNMTWKGYAKDMLKYKARSRALKSKFADCLNGIAIAEHDYDVNPATIDTQKAITADGAATDLASKLHG